MEPNDAFLCHMPHFTCQMVFIFYPTCLIIFFRLQIHLFILLGFYLFDKIGSDFPVDNFFSLGNFVFIFFIIEISLMLTYLCGFQFLNRNGLDCTDLDALCIKDQALTNESPSPIMCLDLSFLTNT